MSGATEPLVLGIDTATQAVGVALGDASGPLAHFEALQGRRHAETVVPAVESLLALAGHTTADLTAIAVDIGPGLFTGLRVGVATAKAMALALDIGVIPVSSLELLAAGAALSGTARAGELVAPVVDARRKEVYAALFVIGDDGVPREVVAPFVAPATRVVEVLRVEAEDAPVDTPLLVVGDGAERYPEAFASLRCLAASSPSASVLVDVARGRVPVPADAVELLYLRAPDAEINWVSR